MPRHFGFQYLRQQIADKIAASLGPVVLEILSAKTREKAELAAASTASLMKRAAGGLVRMKYPGKAIMQQDANIEGGIGDPLCPVSLCGTATSSDEKRSKGIA